jgi:uncharacterized membrane protein HdeD (DUF308 family)
VIEKLRLLAFKDSLKTGIQNTGGVLILLGVMCIPNPGALVVNPLDWTSLWPALAAARLFVRYGAILIAVGACLVATSFLIKQRR